MVAAPLTDTPAQWLTKEVEANGTSLRNFIRSRYPSLRDVDDIVQDSYLRMWKAALTRQVQFSKSFLYRVARNLAIDHLRRRQSSPISDRTESDVSFVIEDVPGVVESTITREELCLLALALDSVPPKCRRVLLLSRIEGLPQKEIAAHLNLSLDTVESHIARGLRALREYMRERAERSPRT
ncbi:MAG: polymerase, sigma-24 subunit, subfamily [Verrucomicrobia bacterium]|nr:polymerase, sigma-24 subunit, subfamily [Verrucomicrobiota bacterium]